MDVVIPDHREALKKNHCKNDVVARWVIPVRGKLYDIELEHGTISGKRVIWVNGEEILRRDMMYRLVGEDTFFLEEKRCIIHVRNRSVVECEKFNVGKPKCPKRRTQKIVVKNVC